MYGKWKALWARFLVGSYGETRRDRVLEYVLHRIGDGAHLQDVIQEEYVRRMATRDDVGRILTDPRIVGSAREGMRRDLEFEGMPPRQTSSVDRPDMTTEAGR